VEENEWQENLWAAQYKLNRIQKIHGRDSGRIQSMLQPAETKQRNLIEDKVNNLSSTPSLGVLFFIDL
jgi:hypothetical protein